MQKVFARDKKQKINGYNHWPSDEQWTQQFEGKKHEEKLNVMPSLSKS